MAKYPEHEKAQTILPQSQILGPFLDWLRDEKHLYLCTKHTHTKKCRVDGELRCGAHDGEMLPTQMGETLFEALIAEHLGIDLGRLEAEKQAMLEEIRGRQ